MKKIYIIAFILALLTGISVFSFAKALEKASKREYTEVVTAAVNITERSVLTKDMLIMKSIPTEMVMSSAIKSIDKAVGLFSDSVLEAGEVLSSTKLRKQGENSSGMTYLVPKGKRAFTLNVDAVSGVAGFILPGDRIDILANMVFEKAGSTDKVQVPTSLIVMQNIEVLASGANIKVVENGTSVEYSTLTLAVSPEEAVTLNLAAANGKLRMVLRSPLDNEIVEIKPKTPELVGNTLG